MKRSLILLLAALLLVTGVARADEIAPVTTTAEVLEVQRDGTLRVRAQEQEVLVVPTVGCTYDAYNGIYPGDIIRVTHTGVATASIPPQVSATAIACHWVEGVISEINEATGQALLTDASVGKVWVTLPDEQVDSLMIGKTVRAYYNGVMALSMPPQVYAIDVKW